MIAAKRPCLALVKAEPPSSLADPPTPEPPSTPIDLTDSPPPPDLSRVKPEPVDLVRGPVPPRPVSFTGRLIPPYQPEGVAWMLSRESDSDSAAHSCDSAAHSCDSAAGSEAVRGGILADEMGLGKTLMTLATMARSRTPGTTLIVLPKSVLWQWVDEVKRYTDAAPLVLHPSDVGGSRVSAGEIMSRQVVLTTYSALGRAPATAELFRCSFQRIVLDEAQYIKNAKSRLHGKARLLDARVKWCLTGTPVCRDGKDFRALMAFVGLGTCHDLSDVARRYLLRRTKDQVAATVERLRLPPMEVALVTSKFRYPQEAQLDADLKEQGRVLAAAMQAVGMTREAHCEGMKLVLRRRQVATNAQMFLTGEHRERDPLTGLAAPAADCPAWTHGCTKLDMLREQLQQHPDLPAHKTLVFCHWAEEMDGVESVVRALGRQVLRLDGKVDGPARAALVKLFNASDRHNTMVIQIDCGGVGLNLQTATRVYINSCHWNATSELQAMARAHRTGQTQKVYVKRLVVEQSIDVHVLGVQQRKLDVAADILGDPRIKTQLNRLSLSDFEQLLTG